MYRPDDQDEDLTKQQAEARSVAERLGRTGRYERVLEIVPGAVYELRVRGGVDFRVSVGRALGYRTAASYTYEVDSDRGAGRPWRRCGELSATRLFSSPAAALDAATMNLSIELAPLGD